MLGTEIVYGLDPVGEGPRALAQVDLHVDVRRRRTQQRDGENGPEAQDQPERDGASRDLQAGAGDDGQSTDRRTGRHHRRQRRPVDDPGHEPSPREDHAGTDEGADEHTFRAGGPLPRRHHARPEQGEAGRHCGDDERDQTGSDIAVAAGEDRDQQDAGQQQHPGSGGRRVALAQRAAAHNRIRVGPPGALADDRWHPVAPHVSPLSADVVLPVSTRPRAARDRYGATLARFGAARVGSQERAPGAGVKASRATGIRAMQKGVVDTLQHW